MKARWLSLGALALILQSSRAGAQGEAPNPNIAQIPPQQASGADWTQAELDSPSKPELTSAICQLEAEIAKPASLASPLGPGECGALLAPPARPDDAEEIARILGRGEAPSRGAAAAIAAGILNPPANPPETSPEPSPAQSIDVSPAQPE